MLRVKAITSTGKLPLKHIPKQHANFATNFSEMIILTMLWLRTKNFEKMIQVNNTSTNNTSDMLIFF